MKAEVYTIHPFYSLATKLYIPPLSRWDALFRTLNYTITYKAKGKPEKAMEYALPLEEALSSQTNVDQTPEEKLFLEAAILLIKEDPFQAISKLKEIDTPDEWSLSALNYLSEKFNPSEGNIQNLKSQHQGLKGVFKEDYCLKILDILYAKHLTLG